MKWPHQAKALLERGGQFQISYPSITEITSYKTNPSASPELHMNWDTAVIEPYGQIKYNSSLDVTSFYSQEQIREQIFREMANELIGKVEGPTIPLLLEDENRDGFLREYSYKLLLNHFKYYPWSQSIESLGALEIPIKDLDLRWSKKNYSLKHPNDADVDKFIESQRRQTLRDYYENLIYLASESDLMFISYPVFEVENITRFDEFVNEVELSFDGSIYKLEQTRTAPETTPGPGGQK